MKYTNKLIEVSQTLNFLSFQEQHFVHSSYLDGETPSNIGRVGEGLLFF